MSTPPGTWYAILMRSIQGNLIWPWTIAGALAAESCMLASAAVSAHSLAVFALLVVFAIVPVAAAGAICSLALYPIATLCLRRKEPRHAMFSTIMPTLAVATLSGFILNPTGVPDHIPIAIVTISVASIAFCAICAFSLPNRTSVSRPQCENCGYDLTGNKSNRCPECGNGVSVRPSPEISR